MRCPNCHSKLSEKSMMCVHCGKIFRLVDGEMIEVEQKEVVKVPPLDFTTLDMSGSYLKAKDISLDDLMKYFEQSRTETDIHKSFSLPSFFFGPLWYWYQNEFIAGLLDFILLMLIMIYLPCPVFWKMLATNLSVFLPFTSFLFLHLPHFLLFSFFNFFTSYTIKKRLMKWRFSLMKKIYAKEDIGLFMVRVDRVCKTGGIYVVIGILLSILLLVIGMLYFRMF